MGRRKSSWLESAPSGTEPCGACNGTGYASGKQSGPVCPSCRGFGY